MKKLKKALFYATPVVLAGFLYLGENTEGGNVLAKTIKTVVTTMVKGEIITYPALMDTDVQQTVTHVTEMYDGNSGSIKSVNTELWLEYPRDSDRLNKYVYDGFLLDKTTIETDIEVPDDPSSESPKVVPTVDPEAAEAARREQERQQEKQREEAAAKAQKEAEQQVEDFYKTIQKAINKARSEDSAASGSIGTAMIKTTYFTCFTQRMMDLLVQNSDLSYEIYYRYKGRNYVLMIPAGADYSKLQASNGYYGFRYLTGMFSGNEVK